MPDAAHRDYAPQLATLVKTAPSGDDWLHEIKYDGYRIGCRIRNGRVSLITRNGNDWTAAFPEIAEAAAALPTTDALLDGEAAVVLPDGRTSFQALQNILSGPGSRAALVYFVFDLLREGGTSLAALPLAERKTRLRALVGGRQTGRIRYSDHVTGRGDAFFAHACAAGLEGIISKRASQPYRRGRHPDWVKTKCVLRQEFVIGGFTDPEGSRSGLGALLVGCYERDAAAPAARRPKDSPGRLVFSGKVGTGFTHKGAVALRRQLDAIEQAECPFSPPPAGPLGRQAHWVKPVLVGEVVFTEWTGDGKIRHPSFQGLRADKDPASVTRERPVESAASTPAGAGGAAAPASPPRRATGRASRRTASAPRSTVAGVSISHPDRVVYPEPATTKLEVAEYYARIAPWMVPHIEGRPLTLVRCPQGITGGCFYMKHSQVWAPEPLRRVPIQEKAKVGEYLVAGDAAGLVALAQMGVLEIHTWNSTVDRIERPDRLVLDLDPGDEVPWTDVVSAARVVRKALAALDLASFPKTTGGRGLHVVVPLQPQADWSQCLEFSRRLSEAIERADPETYTTRFAKAGRKRKILLDYLRNNRTNTSIAAYSTRARSGAPVSVPLTWEELRPALDPQALTLRTVPQRLARLSRDPWREYWKTRQRLTAQRLRAVGASG